MIRRASRYFVAQSSHRRHAKYDAGVIHHQCIRLLQTSSPSSVNIYSSIPALDIGSSTQQYGTYIAKETRRLFSTAVATSNTSSSSSSDSQQSSSSSSSSDDKGDKSKKKKDDSNIFLDNLGKIFLSSIGLILFMLLRSTKSNNSRSALREDIESTSLLDPLEIDDLRVANVDFNMNVWNKIVGEIKREFPNRTELLYTEFLSVVMKVMKGMKGEGFTIQFGHLVDRVVVAELERIGREKGEAVGSGEEVKLPLPFLYAALSLALNSSVADRIQALYETMLEDDSNNNDTTVLGDKVVQMVQHLQNTCQLVPEAQIVETNSKIPYQTFRVGTGAELTKRAREGFGGKKGSAGVTAEPEGPVSLEDFHAILKSRTVCAWGECYNKKSSRMGTSDR